MKTQAALSLLRQIPSHKITAQLFPLTTKDSIKKKLSDQLASYIANLSGRSDVVVLVAEVPKAKSEALNNR